VSHITSKQLRKLRSGEPLTGYENEGQLVKHCIRWLESVGCEAWRNNTGAAMLPGKGGKMRPVRFGKKGHADIFGIIPGGRWVVVETKLPGNKPTPEQVAFLARVREMGGVAILAHSVDELAAEYLSQTKGER
jgi:hypothetical protein